MGYARASDLAIVWNEERTHAGRRPLAAVSQQYFFFAATFQSS